jgi:hypothetical protein
VGSFGSDDNESMTGHYTLLHYLYMLAANGLLGITTSKLVTVEAICSFAGVYV